MIDGDSLLLQSRRYTGRSQFINCVSASWLGVQPAFSINNQPFIPALTLVGDYSLRQKTNFYRSCVCLPAVIKEREKYREGATLRIK